MSIAPFGARPTTPQSERRRTRLALAIATLGIAATLLAYAVSPGVRHAVSHAAHSVKHAVSRMLDHDTRHHVRSKSAARTKRPARTRHPATRTRATPPRRSTAQQQLSGGLTITSGQAKAPR